MYIAKINSINPNTKTIETASEIILAGGVVVYPTDTAYGIGVDATS